MCPTCYFEAAECTKCGVRGHVAKWCGKVVQQRLSIGNTPTKPDVDPTRGSIPDALLVQAVDAAEAHARKRKLSENAACVVCQAQTHGDGLVCGECYKAHNKCFVCQEAGHMYKECPKRVKA